MFAWCSLQQTTAKCFHGSNRTMSTGGVWRVLAHWRHNSTTDHQLMLTVWSCGGTWTVKCAQCLSVSALLASTTTHTLTELVLTAVMKACMKACMNPPVSTATSVAGALLGSTASSPHRFFTSHRRRRRRRCTVVYVFTTCTVGKDWSYTRKVTFLAGRL